MRNSRFSACVAAFVLASAAPALLFAGDACKNVKFKVHNKHDSEAAILIKKVEYYNKANGKWQSEVVNQGFYFDTSGKLQMIPLEKGHGLYCKYDQTCVTGGDNLRDSEGEALTKVRFVYQYWASGKWSGEVTGSAKEPDSTKCVANKTYTNGDNGFAIFGT